MNDRVEELKVALGADTDIRLAAMLGVERSTVAQWRRRGSVPARYDVVLGAVRGSMRYEHDMAVNRLAIRRIIYGDGPGRFIMAAVLACVPLQALDFGPEQSSANVGWSRESRLLSIARVVLNVCTLVLGKPRCESQDEFVRIMRVLEEPEHQRAIALAAEEAAIGEL